MINHFLYGRVVVTGVRSIEGRLLEVLLHTETPLVSVTLHFSEDNWRGMVLVVEGWTTLASLNRAFVILHILIREPVQVDIIDLLKPYEAAYVSKEVVNAQDNGEIEPCNQTIFQNWGVTLRIMKLKQVQSCKDC